MSDYRPPFAACFVALIAAFFFPFVPWWFLNDRADEKIGFTETQIAELDKQVEQAKAAQRKYAQFQDEMVRLGVELDKLRRILPPDEDQGSVIKILSTAAALNNVRVTEIRRVRDTAAAPLMFAEYQVSAQGTTDNLRGFFNEIRNAARILNAPAVSLRRSGSEWNATARLTAASMK